MRGQCHQDIIRSACLKCNIIITLTYSPLYRYRCILVRTDHVSNNISCANNIHYTRCPAHYRIAKQNKLIKRVLAMTKRFSKVSVCVFHYVTVDFDKAIRQTYVLHSVNNRYKDCFIVHKQNTKYPSFNLRNLKKFFFSIYHND